MPTPLEHILSRPAPPHPRLFVSADDLSALPARVQADPRLARLAEHILAQAETALLAPPPERRMEGRRLLQVSRDVLGRTFHLATAYHLTGDTRFSRGAITNLLSACAFTDWNPTHFLDAAEMTLAVALGYDWLHAELTESERLTLREAIVSKAFVPSLESEPWWARCHHNWNQVCHAGLSAGAVALFTEAPDLASRILARAIECVPIAMASSYAPDGAYPEGPMYWIYGTSFNVLLVAMLEHAFGSHFGLADAPGFMATADFLCHVTAPSRRMFNYADTHSDTPVAPVALFWFAQRLQRPELAAVHGEILDAQLAAGLRGDARLLPLLLFWLRDTPVTRPLPLDWHGRGLKPVAMHRRDWTPESPYAAILAGTPSSNHGHMDIGAFVFEAHGVRWALDLGGQNYNRLETMGVKLWDGRQQGGRWSLFRYGTTGHNTLTIDDQDQRVDGHATLAAFADDADHPFSVVDMSRVYAGQAATVVRGLRLHGRQHLVIVDTLTGLQPGARVRWRMNTRATVSVSGATATLEESGRQIVARVLPPDQARWEVEDVSQPHAEWDEPNPGVSQLVFTRTAPANGRIQMTVVIDTGLTPAPTEAEIAAWGAPIDWSATPMDAAVGSIGDR